MPKLAVRGTLLWPLFALALAAVLLGAIVRLSDSLPVRLAALGSSNNCYYRLATSIGPHVHTFFVGSSRIRRGISPERFSEKMGVASDSVMNFGRPGADFRMDSALFFLASQRAQLTLALIEVNAGEAQPIEQVRFVRSTYSSWYPAVASLEDLGRDRSFKAKQPMPIRAYEFLNLVMRKIELTTKLLLSRRLRETLRPDADDLGLHNLCWRKSWDSPGFDDGDTKQRDAKQKLRTDFLARAGDWHAVGDGESDLLDAAHRQDEVVYYQEIVKFAEKHGIKIAFIYLPTYFTWPPSAEWKAKFGSLIGAPILVPDKALLASLHANGYVDQTHLTRSGRTVFTDWIFSELDKYGLVQP